MHNLKEWKRTLITHRMKPRLAKNLKKKWTISLRASVNNPLGGALHHKQVSVVILVLGLVDGDLELVGGVEGNLADLPVGRPELRHTAVGEF